RGSGGVRRRSARLADGSPRVPGAQVGCHPGGSPASRRPGRPEPPRQSGAGGAGGAGVFIARAGAARRAPDHTAARAVGAVARSGTRPRDSLRSHRMQHRSTPANGIGIHYVEAGSGPPIVLLHGFPEFWYAWRRQLPALAAAGFRAVAPDLRGYNLTEGPRGVERYRIEHLVEDAVGLIDALGETRVVLVGHDWGGVVAWYAAMLHPGRVSRLVVLNAPHPAAYARELRRLSSQVWRSGYAG